MAERIDSYRDLAVWQRGMALAEEVYRLTGAYPRDELFGLTAQTRRAATSVPANIAEGYGRGTQGAYLSFLRIARGSLRELETHLMLADRLGLAPGRRATDALAEAERIARMLHSLIAKVGNAQPI